jgi:DNA excision repair protein ERCC-3
MTRSYILLTKGSGEEDWGSESTQYLAEKGIDITKIEYSQLTSNAATETYTT